MTAIKICFAITDLFLIEKPIFYKNQICPDIKVGVLWTSIISNAIILASAYLIYRLFSRVVKRAIWKSQDSRLLTYMFITNISGIFASKLSELIAKDFLAAPSRIGCPIYTNMITSQYYIKLAVMELLFNPMFMIVILCMALLCAFFKYSYGVKEENESFI